MKPRPEVNKDYKPTPYCRGSNECSCFSAYFGYGGGPTRVVARLGVRHGQKEDCLVKYLRPRETR